MGVVNTVDSSKVFPNNILPNTPNLLVLGTALANTVFDVRGHQSAGITHLSIQVSGTANASTTANAVPVYQKLDSNDGGAYQLPSDTYTGGTLVVPLYDNANTIQGYVKLEANGSITVSVITAKVYNFVASISFLTFKTY